MGSDVDSYLSPPTTPFFWCLYFLEGRALLSNLILNQHFFEDPWKLCSDRRWSNRQDDDFTEEWGRSWCWLGGLGVVLGLGKRPSQGYCFCGSCAFWVEPKWWLYHLHDRFARALLQSRSHYQRRGRYRASTFPSLWCTCMGIWRFLCGAVTLCNFVFLSLRGCGVALHWSRMMVQAQRTMRSQNGFLSRKTCKRTCKKVTWMHNLHEWCSCVLQKRTRNVQKQTRCILCSADDSGKHMSKVINFNNCISQIFCSVVMPVLLSTNSILTINENVERSRIYKRRISKPGNY